MVLFEDFEADLPCLEVHVRVEDTGQELDCGWALRVVWAHLKFKFEPSFVEGRVGGSSDVPSPSKQVVFIWDK